MKRKIIRIDADVCNGCGECLPNCPEGALQLIDQKARLVSDLFCDGLGACIGTCPLGAIHVEEREAEPYDERRVMANIVTQGANVIRAHIDHLAAHNELGYLEQAREFLREQGLPLPEAKRAEAAKFQGCPGSQTHDRRGQEAAHPAPAAAASTSATAAPSELRTWPVQLQLLNPQASFFDNADLLVAADCVPFAHASFHEDFVKGKIPLIFCPKLDHTGDQYLEKLTAILTLHAVRSLHIVHMEVPCCSGTTALAREALARSGKTIPVHDYTISIQGQLLATKHA
jgi:NAD-dependent dihydropyrimidine dehydrogenase PreA subunit